jgi:two-component system, cell cycle response regulator DivK
MAHSKVLIVEDNDNNMELITFILELAGYQTLKAFNGRDGIHSAIHADPDFVLLDIQLPDMDGSDVLLAIRNNERTVELPVIAVTSYAMSGDREKLIAKGCTGYIEKPINPETIITDIKNILESQPCRY